VRKAGTKFEVVAGARRLAALRILAKEAGGDWSDDSPVPVKILNAENDAEISLAENTVREAMHAADQIEAFRALIEDKGMTPEQVGDRFGISHMTVRRRVKLANVSPAILTDFRSGAVTMQELEALAVSDDHNEQERVLAALPSWQRNPDAIRAQLTREKIKADHRLVAFVGLDAYLAAGGTVTRDLFATDADAYLDDKALVMRLASARVQDKAEAIRSAEGWKWAEGYLSESEARAGHPPSIAAGRREPTEDEAAERDALAAWFEDNEPAYEAGEMTDEGEAEYTRKIERLDELDDALVAYDPEGVALAGVRVAIDHAGGLMIRRGLLKPEDAHELEARRRAAQQAQDHAEQGDGGDRDEDGAEDEGDDDETPVAPAEAIESADYSAALIADLTLSRSLAMSAAVAHKPDVALALLVHRLALTLFFPHDHTGRTASAVKIGGGEYINRTPRAPDDDNAAIADAVAAQRAEIKALLPERAADLFEWCVEADHKTLLRVLACCVAERIDVRADAASVNASPYDRDRIVAGNQIARLVGLDMAELWRPSEAFMKRLNKTQIAHAVSEAGGPPDLAKAIKAAPKADAIKAALDYLDGQRWTPAPLRTPALSPFASAAAQPDAAAA
jgi:ParB family chromosome partitioning protein